MRHPEKREGIVCDSCQAPSVTLIPFASAAREHPSIYNVLRFFHKEAPPDKSICPRCLNILETKSREAFQPNLPYQNPSHLEALIFQIGERLIGIFPD